MFMPLNEYINKNYNGVKKDFADDNNVTKQQVNKWINAKMVVIGNKLYSERRELKNPREFFMNAYIYNADTNEIIAIIEAETYEQCESIANDMGYMGTDEYGLSYNDNSLAKTIDTETVSLKMVLLAIKEANATQEKTISENASNEVLISILAKYAGGCSDNDDALCDRFGIDGCHAIRDAEQGVL